MIIGRSVPKCEAGDHVGILCRGSVFNETIFIRSNLKPN
jgi:hypothetical protein